MSKADWIYPKNDYFLDVSEKTESLKDFQKNNKNKGKNPLP